MSEYTPSTEEVRAEYMAGRGRMDLVHDGHTGPEFDRWLAFERARIWDEGRAAGFDVARWGGLPLLNPYRKDGDGE